MPLKSAAQREWFRKNRPDLLAEMEAETTGPLPQRAHKKITGIPSYFPKKRKGR